MKLIWGIVNLNICFLSTVVSHGFLSETKVALLEKRGCWPEIQSKRFYYFLERSLRVVSSFGEK